MDTLAIIAILFLPGFAMILAGVLMVRGMGTLVAFGLVTLVVAGQLLFLRQAVADSCRIDPGECHGAEAFAIIALGLSVFCVLCLAGWAFVRTRMR